MKTKETVSRSDRVLIGALAIVLATASAAIGASWTNNPGTDKVHVVRVEKPVVKVVTAPAVPAQTELRNAATNTVLARLLQEHKCLAEVMYYEARGEGEDGQKAVAEVVFHRMNTGAYGHSICAVVYEGVTTGACQFSFACDGSRSAKHEPGPWREAQALAARIMAGEEPLQNTTDGAVAFHTSAVQPDWSGYERTVQIGNHIFYRRQGHSSGA
ncbi:MAG: cell wall hydrolase [Proteobacteria bacterium]|nr:cell wall hydrolase [Pseudomonadota bacterium]